MQVENISVGDIYYVTCRWDCKSCFRVEVLEVLNDNNVKVIAIPGKNNKGKKKHKKKGHKPFTIYVSSLHKTPDKAVHGYRQHH